MRRVLHQQFQGKGVAPDKLVRVPSHEPENQPPSLLVIDFLDGKPVEKSLAHVGDIGPYLNSDHPTWIDVGGAHPIKVMEEIQELLGLHRLTLEDILNTDQRPKTEDFKKHIFIVLKKPVYRVHSKRVELEQVSIILTATAVVSFHETPPSSRSTIRLRMLHDYERIGKLGTDYLAYMILDSVVDEYFLVMEGFEDRIQHIEEALAKTPGEKTLQEIYRLKQEVILMRKSVWPLREVISFLSHTSSPLFDDGIKLYLKDLRDHIIQVIDVTDIYRDMLSSTLDLYLSTMSNRMNQIMKTLTMIASIFIPLTLITGIYGMNFTDMPELHWAWGYPLTIAIMVVVAGGMLIWFKRRKWF